MDRTGPGNPGRRRRVVRLGLVAVISLATMTLADGAAVAAGPVTSPPRLPEPTRRTLTVWSRGPLPAPPLVGAPRAALANPARAAVAAQQLLTGASEELGAYRRAAQVVVRRMAARRAADEAAAAAAAARRAAEEEAAAREEAARQAARDAAREAARQAATPPAAPAPAPAAPAPRPSAEPPPALLAGADVAAEARFLALVNDVRAQSGLGPLAVDGRLHAAAQAWAQQLAQEGALRHQDVGRFLGAWSTAAENVAFGPNVDAMFRALAASPRHYANIVKGEFSAVGIGVVPAADGTLWTSHLFAG